MSAVSVPAATNTGKIWFPILQTWLKASFAPAHVLYIAIDRTKWGCINLLMISLIWDRRAYPVYWNFYKRNSDFEEQTISKCYRYSKSIKQSYWGDRILLGKTWLTQEVYFCVRLKQNEFVQLEDEMASVKGVRFNPWNCLYLNGVSVTKQRGFSSFNVACKWKRKYWGWAPDEWFILTNLSDLESAILAYKNALELRRCARDFKSGGYNLEGTITEIAWLC